MLTGDYKFKNIFSGVITNLDEENLAINLSKDEKLLCPNCQHSLEKFKNYNRIFEGIKFLLDVHYCDKCRTVYELTYMYNEEITALKKYIKRNKLIVLNQSNNYIQSIN